MYPNLPVNYGAAGWGSSSPMWQWFLPMMGIFLTFGVILYVYVSLTTYAIAKKLKHPMPWLAWIPIANNILLWQISDTPQWTVICYFAGLLLAWVPILGWLISFVTLAIMIYWWWKVCEKLHWPNWWPIFIIIFLPVWLVFMGIMAWSDAPKS